MSARSGVVGAWTAHENRVNTDVAEVAVEKGETIDFIVDCIGENSFDSFLWTPELRQVDGELVWNANLDFQDPRTPHPKKTSSAVEQVTQALLLSNEFAFVD